MYYNLYILLKQASGYMPTKYKANDKAQKLTDILCVCVVRLIWITIMLDNLRIISYWLNLRADNEAGRVIMGEFFGEVNLRGIKK